MLSQETGPRLAVEAGDAIDVVGADRLLSPQPEPGDDPGTAIGCDAKVAYGLFYDEVLVRTGIEQRSPIDRQITWPPTRLRVWAVS